MVLAHCPWLESSCPEDNQASPGSLREARGAWFDVAHHPELVEGKEVPEALSNRNGEGAIAISPSRARSKRHLAPHFVTDSLSTTKGHPNQPAT